MTAAEFLPRVIRPAQAWCTLHATLPQSPASDRILLAIAGQESNWQHRAQIVHASSQRGPARGFWQFERGGGVAGVINHAASRDRAEALCRAAGVQVLADAAWRNIEMHDGLAYGFARLLLLTDPPAIPTTQDAAWACYMRCWRPGKPHLSTWPRVWEAAGKALAAG